MASVCKCDKCGNVFDAQAVDIQLQLLDEGSPDKCLVTWQVNPPSGRIYLKDGAVSNFCLHICPACLIKALEE